MIDSITLDLLKVLKEILDKGCMLPTFNKGVIIFIPRNSRIDTPSPFWAMCTSSWQRCLHGDSKKSSLE